MSPDISWLQSVVVAAVVASTLGGIFALVQLAGNKKLRTPADRLAEVEFYVKLSQEQVKEAKADKKSLEDTLTILRSYVADLENRNQRDNQLISDLYTKIHDLERRHQHKDDLIDQQQGIIDRVAAKVANGEPITLADLGGKFAVPLSTGSIGIVA